MPLDRGYLLRVRELDLALFQQKLSKTSLCIRQDTLKRKQAIYIYIYIYIKVCVMRFFFGGGSSVIFFHSSSQFLDNDTTQKLNKRNQWVLIKFLKFILKTWINRRMSYFLGSLSGVGDIFLLGYPLVLSLWNVESRGFSKPQKSPVHIREFCLYTHTHTHMYMYILASSHALYACNEAFFGLVS